MSSTTINHRPPLSRLPKAALALEMLLSIGALGGRLVLIVAPRGEVMPLVVGVVITIIALGWLAQGGLPAGCRRSAAGS